MTDFISNVFSSLGKTSSETVYASSLFICLKDHNNLEAYNLSSSSMQHSVLEAVQKEGFDVDEVAIAEGKGKPLQIVLTEKLDCEVRNQVLEGLKKLSHVDLNYELTNLSGEGKLVFVILQLLLIMTA